MAIELQGRRGLENVIPAYCEAKHQRALQGQLLDGQQPILGFANLSDRSLVASFTRFIAASAQAGLLVRDLIGCISNRAVDPEKP